MGRTWTHDGVSGSYSTASPLRPGDGRRSFSGSQPRPIPPLQPVRLLAKAEPIPADPAEHAIQFAQDWYDRLEFHSRRRMRELGIPEHRIGAYDLDFDFRRAAFFPKERSARPETRAGGQKLVGERPAPG